jgi:hypothetical protein
MKLNLQKSAYCATALTMAAVLAGCMNDGAALAEESGKFAICTLDQGQSCKVSAPIGAKVEKASLTADGDAIRVTSTVKSQSDCEGFASHAKSRSPKYMAQATINTTVVTPYGDLPHEPSIQTACATPPYTVSITVAKAL